MSKKGGKNKGKGKRKKVKSEKFNYLEMKKAQIKAAKKRGG